MIRLTRTWSRYLRYYESMKKEFPDEAIWDRAIEDVKSLLRGSASSRINTERGEPE